MPYQLTAELLQAVSLSVEARLGLHYPPERWADLERGLTAAAADLGFEGAESCAREMLRAGLDPGQIEALAAHLTIGETYFFRDPNAFAALENKILPAIRQTRRDSPKRLRIWSAGCCTGEEPYSIAMALHRALPDLADWHITILATDLNPRFLQTAIQGIYGRWSFRGVPEMMKSSHFRPIYEGRFEVVKKIREIVEFGCLNLVEDVFPSLTNNTNAMDIIFCRNVLMYFSREQLRKVLAKLHGSLSEGGWLFISATEASPELFTAFTPSGFEGTAIYRKTVPAPVSAAKAPSPAALTAQPAAFPSDPHQAAKRTRTKVPTQRVPPVQPAVNRKPEAAPADLLAEARRLANIGCLPEALTVCDRAIAAEKLSAASHYLRGVILHEQNQVDEAAQSIRRALYLDHDFVVAHFALGNLMLRQGRSRDAKRCFENARTLLANHPEEAVLPESDGVTAGRLLAVLSSLQEVAA